MIKIAVIEDELLHLLQVVADICSFDPEGNDVSILPVLVKPESQATVETEMAQVRERLDSLFLAGNKKLKFPSIDQSLGLIDFEQPPERDRLLSYLSAQRVDVILSDCSMGPQEAGVELLNAASADRWMKQTKWQCWLMTQYPDVHQMLHVTQEFLYFDPYTHSFDKSVMLKNGTGECAPELRNILENAIKARRERETIEADYWFRSPALHEQFEKNAREPGPVVIIGPAGTRKKSAAQSLHNRSDHHPGPFISFSCGDDSKKDIEWKLFGRNDHEGLVERARGGTLFLDEINELPSDTQLSLLRVLQTRSVMRMGHGEQEQRPVEFRLVAGTSQELDQGGLRKDLSDFLHNGKIEISSLHERIDDLQLLVEEFLREDKPGAGPQSRSVSPAVMKIFKQWSWPGNDQELQQIIESARSQCAGDVIDALCPVIQEIHRKSELPEYQTIEQIWSGILSQRHSWDLNGWRRHIGLHKTLKLAEFAKHHFQHEGAPKYFGGMSHAKFKLSLGRLRLQLWIERIKEKHRQTRDQTRTMWEQIFGWQVIVVLIGIIPSLGTFALGISEFRLAKGCVAAFFVLLIARSVLWVVRQKSHFLMRLMAGCFVLGLVSISSIASWRWVDNRQQAAKSGQDGASEGIEKMVGESIELAKKIGQMAQKWEQQIQPIRDRYSASEADAEAWATDPEVLILSKEIVGLYEANYKARAIEVRNKLLEKLKPALIDVRAEFEDAPDTPLHVKASNYKLIAAELERLAAEVKTRFAQR